MAVPSYSGLAGYHPAVVLLMAGTLNNFSCLQYQLLGHHLLAFLVGVIFCL